MNSVKLKTIISKQVPNFVQEDHQGLQQFLEAYYDYIDQFVNKDIASLRDLDNTLDEFVIHIKNELDIFGDTEYDYIDKILLLRKIKQVLMAKGSEAAYKFLFKILYDKPVNITYPWDSVLKASDGKWKRDTSLFIRITEGSPLDLTASRVSIVGSQRTMYVYVDNIRHIEDDVFEFFIEKSYYGTISIGDQLVFGDIRGTILPTTVKYEIINAGTGYQVGDVINASTFANNKTISQRIKVTGVDNDGGITSLITLRFGYDYTSEFFLYTTNQQVIRKSRFALTKATPNPTNPTAPLVFVSQFDVPDQTEVEMYSDYGQVTTPNYWLSYTKTITINPTGSVSTTNDTISSTAHGFITGDIVNYTTAGTAIGGLTIGNNYFVIKIDDNVFKLSSSLTLANANSAINLTNLGSGTSHTFIARPATDLAYSGTLLQQFYTETPNNVSDVENFTLIRFDIGAVAKYQGYYYSNDGFLSDNIYIQDSRYYQKYSYLVTIDQRLEDYKALLRSFIHPAGVALFGEYQIQSNFTSNLKVSFNLDEYTSKSSVITINRNIDDTLINSVNDLGGYVDMNPYDLENYVLRTQVAADRYNAGTMNEKDTENLSLITIPSS